MNEGTWKFSSLPVGDENKHLFQELHQDKLAGVTNLMPGQNFQQRFYFKPFWGWFHVSRDRILCAAHLSRHNLPSNQFSRAPRAAWGMSPSQTSRLMQEHSSATLPELQDTGIQQQFLSQSLKALQSIRGMHKQNGPRAIKSQKGIPRVSGFRCTTAQPEIKRTTRLIWEPKLT